MPLPIDIVLIALGERAGAGEVPLWVVMAWLEVVVVAGTAALFLVTRRMGQRLVERLRSRRPSIGSRIDRVSATFARRGNLALVVGRATPGLRALTVIVAGLSVVRTSVAVILLVVGSSLFVQGHVLLGYAIGPAARSILEDLPLLGLSLIALIVVAGLAVWVVRRGRNGLNGWSEGTCPACLAVGLRGDDGADRRG